MIRRQRMVLRIATALLAGIITVAMIASPAYATIWSFGDIYCSPTQQQGVLKSYSKNGTTKMYEHAYLKASYNVGSTWTLHWLNYGGQINQAVSNTGGSLDGTRTNPYCTNQT